LFLGSEGGGHGTVASALLTLVPVTRFLSTSKPGYLKKTRIAVAFKY